MKLPLIALCLVAILALSAGAEEPKPPKPVPKPKPAAPKQGGAKKPKATVKPQPSRKDMAIKEARRTDQDKNGRIDGLEVMSLNNVLKNNPDSFLYLFDEDGSHSLSTQEIAAINELIKPKKK